MSKTDSIKARLRALAVQTQKPYEYLQTHYFIERFLYRLSISKYGARFVLKGGLLLHVLFDRHARATRDIDLLARQTENEPEILKEIVRDVCSMKVDDGVIFDLNSITTEPMSGAAEYAGIRLGIIGYLDRSRCLVQLDIGFGDAVIPGPEFMKYPTLVSTDEITLLVYSKESGIAEKFQAMVDLALANSRMKDLYDIAMMASVNDFDGEVLQKAIAETFRRRGTQMPETPILFTSSFTGDRDKLIQWSAFRKRTQIPTRGLAETAALIQVFLQPVIDAILTGTVWSKCWLQDRMDWS